MRERDIRKLLKERVEAYGGEIRAVSWLGRAHAPDVLVLMPGVHFFVETKAPGGKPRPGQLREHDRMRASNCAVFVITTPEDLDRWLPPI
jgi:hypothetical protein